MEIWFTVSTAPVPQPPKLEQCLGHCRHLPRPSSLFHALIFYFLLAKSLQSCPTLCDPIDGSPPGSPVPGILQARTLEWVAISFSNAWKWKWKWSRSHVSDSSRPHGLQPTRLLRPWEFPAKNTGVGYHFLLQCRKVRSESCKSFPNGLPRGPDEYYFLSAAFIILDNNLKLSQFPVSLSLHLFV